MKTSTMELKVTVFTLLTLQISTSMGQRARPSVVETRGCAELQNYCYRTDVCAYVFNIPANEDGSCTSLQDTVASVSYIEGNIELLRFHISDINAQIALQNSDMDEWQRLMLQQVYEREKQEERIAEMQEEIGREFERTRSLIEENQEDLQVLNSSISTEKESTETLLVRDELLQLVSEVHSMRKEMEEQRQIIEGQTEKINVLESELEILSVSQGCNLEYNIDRPGGNMENVPVEVTSNPVECCLRCKDTPKCRGFAFMTDTGLCYLKDSKPKKERGSPNAVSGVVF